MTYPPIKLTKHVFFVGVKDPDLRVFDIIMETKFGTTYNAYLVKGSEKAALIDAAKADFTEEHIARIEAIMPIEKIDYLILNHTEPDHSGSAKKLLEINPNMTIVASAPGLSNLKAILNQAFPSLRATNELVLPLGGAELRFFIQPNLHWPDTIFTYLPQDQVLFTCDFFGAHYGLTGLYPHDFPSEAAFTSSLEHYFVSIMAPFKVDVQRALDLIDTLDVKLVATSHGAIIDEAHVDKVKRYYREWSQPHPKHSIPLVVIPIASAYGYTAKIADKVEEGLKQAYSGAINVEKYDVVTTPLERIVERIGEADAFLIGSTTILKDTVKPIWDILSSLNPEIHGRKKASAFGSYGWSGEAVNHIIERLKQLKMQTIEGLRIRFNPSNDEQDQAVAFGRSFAEFLKNND
ncbi:MAG: FprA family A-type flavoprotein [Candidatus Izemoplasmatales bacterium]|nr:FprA family A-type flavoprotein [Candidatus Izemoplasmatales bacterium]